MSIIGEMFPGWVQTQIQIRQGLQGRKNRNNQQLNVLSNNNAWLKLGSSVKITDDEIGIVTQGTDSSTIDNLEQQSGDPVRFTEKTGKEVVDRKFSFTSNYDQLKKLGGSGSSTNAQDYIPNCFASRD